MNNGDDIGDRMKWYEEQYTNTQFLPMIPVMARLDGRSFHNFTKDLNRPYDERFSRLMVDSTKYLVKETNSRCGYTQSDEITLVWLSEEWKSEIFFSGKLQKMNSILASMTTAYFNQNIPKYLPEKDKELPLFDCRLFQVPTDFEATNCFLWRELDATRNSVQMAARSVYSHTECFNKDSKDLMEMLFSKGINWNDYPNFFKRGTYVRKRILERAFTAKELEELPEKHDARNNPDLIVKRTVVMEEDFPILSKIPNRERVILHGEDPNVC